MEEQLFLDEEGRKYRLVNKTKEVPRNTYLLGTLYGKYWGEMDGRKESEYKQVQFYDFHIYEAEVHNAEISRMPFAFTPDAQFPRERLPKLLPVISKKDGNEYELNIHEPQIANVQFIAALHQTEGKEVFGTIVAQITGYLLDFCTEDCQEREYLQDAENATAQPSKNTTTLAKTATPTGNVEFKKDYQRAEYYYSDYKTKYWSDWRYKRSGTTPVGEGCLSSMVSILSGVIGVVFLILLLPKIAIMLPFLLLPVIFHLLPEPFWRWIFRLIALILLAGMVISIVNKSQRFVRSSIPRPIVRDEPKERKPQYYPVTDTVNQKPVTDTLITHYRSWKDYKGNEYAGKFWVKKSAFINASSFKNNLKNIGNTEDSYREMVYHLKENDKNNLPGVYQLFDSIKAAKCLPADQFAELIVSFVQDIPYTVVLPDACDGSLYADHFIKSYLSGNNARCDGYERFGINTPVEFMATLNGDCDTRTLLLYTMLSHYGYDVAIINSNYYNHSLIGINLPYSGIAYTYNSRRYVLWETTAPGIEPGIIPNKITNLNYWSIALKSE
ncbi:ABC transporter permease [Niabella drilacis]|uniref:Transglutaminase-like superfamily protein n=1 Tax=Niabella drilacis (strain DSM 25811 / CCM 8410 / CCUG 62505 / LMG 26954 / E90) TaxID=1285928 RepID=A0A1G6PIS9_NIADE|nr:ABC transporter permease [Niabella drilacis]SDC80130.1 hypothetical protein SAMN04487894_10455 [Niabella drilacis]